MIRSFWQHCSDSENMFVAMFLNCFVAHHVCSFAPRLSSVGGKRSWYTRSVHASAFPEKSVRLLPASTWLVHIYGSVIVTK